MKKYLIPFLIFTVLLTGCTAGTKDYAAEQTETVPSEALISESENTEESENWEDMALRAMYLVEEIHLFTGTESGSLFTAPIPEELYNTAGERITEDELTVGSVVDIYGNQIMLDSFPGQYPGVTKMIVVTEGTKEDTVPYQDLIDMVYTPADPSEPPEMILVYSNDLYTTSVMLTRSSYTWNYTDDNGESCSIMACGSTLLEDRELLNEVKLSERTDLELDSSPPPVAVAVTRWALESLEQDGENLPGETVTITRQDDSFLILQAEPGYVYLIEAEYENGTIEFGFVTK